MLQNFPQMAAECLASPWLANAIAVASLIVALFALRRSRKTAQKMLSIEEAREEDRVHEQKSAKLVASLAKDDDVLKVVIKNHGQATARDVEVLFDGEPYLGHGSVPIGPNPVGDIAPVSQVSISIFPGSTDAFKVEITWTDESNVPGKFSGELFPI